MAFGTDTFINNAKFKAIANQSKQHTGKNISFSQYSKYIKCPKSWELRYIHKISISSESISLLFGQAIHSTIQDWLKIMYTESVKKSEAMDLPKILLDYMKKEYAERREKHGSDFSTPEELSSYYNNGVEILKYLKKKRKVYFSSRGMELISIEYPISIPINDVNPNVIFTGYIDLIFYNKVSKKYRVIDIKTSMRGWSEYKKKDQTTTDQLVIYKKVLMDLLKVPADNIEITYLILKSKIQENSLFPQRRIQEFSPANGTTSLKRVNDTLEKFVSKCFNPDGTYNTERMYPAVAGKQGNNCMWCEYESHPLCPRQNRISE